MKNQLSSLQASLATLRDCPGVYRMLNRDGVVLYVGKASNLKKRVRSYFSKQQQGVKINSLINQIVAVDVSITRSETEALLLESNLIKTLHPKYNVLLRDDKSYPYIQVSTHPFPRVQLYRSKKKPKKGEFYGPYPSVAAVKETLKTIHKVFKIRNCSDAFFQARSRPCLQYQIKRCSAPCTALISQVQYEQDLKDARHFLQGKSSSLMDDFVKRMEWAVSVQRFEEAAVLRDQIKNLRLIQEQQAVVHLRGDADVIVIAVQADFACIQCATIREGEVVASQHFFPSLPQCSLAEGEQSAWQAVFEAFIGFYYLDNTERIPACIITNHPLEGSEVIQAALSALRGKPCLIKTKPIGIKARWLDFALNNLHITVTNHLTVNSILETRYQALATLLERKQAIKRMECFDISHTQGKETMASCVVFDSYGPQKSDYRHYTIRNITPGDDYAAMAQVLTRRFKNRIEEAKKPDIVIVDGGKGQVAIAAQILTDLNVKGLSIIGIAKGVSRKPGWERLILGAQEKEIVLAFDSPALHLLQSIRDEAHRFAINAHRKKRHKKSLASSLETIEGVGPKRRQALLSRFGGLRELAQARVEELSKVSGINKNLAKRIYVHFHPESD